MNRPPGIPAHYVETTPGTFCHPSRVLRQVDASQPEQHQGGTLGHAPPASKAGGPGVARRKRRNPDPGGGSPRDATPVLTIHLVVHRKPGKLFDGHDNLRSALKPLVDAIAASLGIEDKDPRVVWEYSQAEHRGPDGVVVIAEWEKKSEHGC